MSFRRKLRRLLKWGFLLTLTVVLGGLIAAYYYATDSDNLADLVRREAPKYLPTCRVDVAKVRVRPFGGEITLTHVLVHELSGGNPGPTVARVPWIQIRFDPWAMLKGKFEPREVTVAEPTIRLRRRADGSWNVQGLLANPWPGPSGGALPPVAIQKGTVELLEEGATAPLTLLRAVSIKIPASSGLDVPVGFELSANGEAGLFDRVRLEGTVEPKAGRVAVKSGELVRLTLSEGSRDRLPKELGRALGLAGLDGGEVDASLQGLSFDPLATPKLRYQASARLRRGLWKCPKLPFPISDLSVDLEARDGELTIARADGSDGSTKLSLRGRASVDLDDIARSTFRVHAEAANLELDKRIRRWIPDEKAREIWDAYFPGVLDEKSTSAGRVDIRADASREAPGAPIRHEVDVTCLDVSMKYKHFAYPVDHIKGNLHVIDKQMTVKLETIVGNKPLRLSGKIDNLGPAAEARLEFDFESVPLDAALARALPPEVLKVYASFRPTGTVKGHLSLFRRPPLNKGDDPKGRVEIDALIDLKDQCSITWDGLKYPVMDLTGRLEIHPKRWVFRDMKGKNGQATINASGEVRELRPKTNKVEVRIQARNLPFDQQLRDALQKPWQVTWGTLNPSGASDIDATIVVDPDKLGRDRDHYRIAIVPLKATGVKLRFNPLVGAGAPPTGPIELRMDDVSGTFVFDTANQPPTSMTDVNFTFQRAPVNFARGVVDVRDSGQFALDVGKLEVKNLRLDEELRRYMPPVMSNFARRLKDDRIAKINTDLSLGWSGRVGESAYCRWNDARVILDDNRVSIGTDLGLEHIHGELNSVVGSFDGRDFQVHGKLDLESLDVLGQQITRVEARLEVERGLARLDQIRGKILGGALTGHVTTSLDTSPKYSTRIEIRDADLHEYALVQAGHQGFRGKVTGWVDLSGLGYDPHTIKGEGLARITQGDLGTLPVALRFINVAKRAKDNKAAFDSAEAIFRVKDGETTIDPVRIVGNAFSLTGKGTVDVRGMINLKLEISPGRDSLHFPLLSDLGRGLGAQIFSVRVQGPVSSPTFRPEVVRVANEVGEALKKKRDIKQTGLTGPLRTGLEPRLLGNLGARWFGRPQ